MQQPLIAEAPTDKIRRWREHPGQMVRELFNATPDAWQDKVLEAFPHQPRQAMKAAKGPGKTTTLSWLGWNFLLTRPHPNVAATSISGDNLRDNLWKEMAVWQNKAPLLQAAFQWSASRIYSKSNPETWFMSARTWSQKADQQRLGETLAGLHSQFILFLIDESGGIPPAIMMSAEGALANLTDGNEAHIVQAGNTNTLEGALYAACVKQARLWHVTVITGDPDDPNRSPRISMQWARDLIAEYGRDNPFVKVMVLGDWPSASVNALLGPEDIEAAMKRCYREYEYSGAPKIIGVDVAREGDDQSVIAKRQGLVTFPFKTFRNINSIQGAGAVAREWIDWDADACFVDNTGGFGAGWIDQLGVLGRQPIPVQYAGAAHDKGKYANKRAEMYFDLAQWVKKGGQLPPETPELMAALTQTCYYHQGDRLILEPKELIKVKIGYSPDHADSLAQTFAEPVSPRSIGNGTSSGRRTRELPPYDPFAEIYGAMDR